MKIFKSKKVVIFLIVVAIVFAGVIIYLLQKKAPVVTPLTIASSTPSEGATEVSVFDPITITFNQDVDATTLYVSSEPSEIWSISQNGSDSVSLGHDQYLRVATPYKITILQAGNLVGTLDFETAHEQNDPRLLQNVQSELDRDYPLGAFTPYETPTFRVVYSSPLTLEIDLKGSANRQTALSDVQTWVKSHGIDPSTHKYVIIGP